MEVQTVGWLAGVKICFSGRERIKTELTVELKATKYKSHSYLFAIEHCQCQWFDKKNIIKDEKVQYKKYNINDNGMVWESLLVSATWEQCISICIDKHKYLYLCVFVFILVGGLMECFGSGLVEVQGVPQP